jgi:hypothetical protein
MKILPLLLLSSLLLIHIAVAKANSFKVDGVLSIGYMAPTSNHFFGAKAGENAVITENALRLSYNFENRFAVSSQVMFREARGFSESGARLDFLQLDYRNSLWDNSQQTYTVGRFKTQQGFYNKTRDIPFTRPSVMLPQSVYYESLRNFVLSLDGVKINSVHSFELSDLTLELGVGKNAIDTDFNNTIFGNTATGNWDSDNNYYTDIKWENQQISLGINYSNVSLDYNPGPGSYMPIEINGMSFPAPLMTGTYSSDIFIYSGQYRLPNWEFTVEHSVFSFDSTGFFAPNSKRVSKIKGTYIQARYFLNEKFILLARYDVMKDVSAAKSAIKSLTQGKDLTLGLTWSFDKQWQLALEHHFIEGILWVPPVTKTTAVSDIDNRWGISAIQLSYRF